MNIRVLDRQSLFDVALQHFGDVEVAFGLALENDLSLTDDVSRLILKSTLSATNASVVAHYRINNIVPATLTSIYGDGGIDFWEIEYDFKVS
jgi:hypothetical protein